MSPKAGIADPARRFPKNLPRADLRVWLITGLCSVVGASISDVADGGDRLVGSILGVAAVAYLAALGVQLRAQRGVPALYWSSDVLTGVIGARVGDELTDRYGMSYVGAAFALCLAIVVAVWWSSERILAIDSISTTRGERFYCQAPPA